MKKTLLLTVLILSITSMAYSYEISVGGSFGAGLPILRGDNVELPDDTSKLATKTKVDVMIEFMPFLALETGLGFKTSTFSMPEGGTVETHYSRKEIFIPVMARGQYEYNLGVSYISAGVNLGFPVSKNYVYSTVDGEEVEGGFGVESSGFAMDVALALGTEFRLGTAHYLGVRLSYDINVVAAHDTTDFSNVLNQDDFTAGVTYRYAFGSKWNK